MYLYLRGGWTNVFWGGLMAVCGGLIAVWGGLEVVWGGLGWFGGGLGWFVVVWGVSMDRMLGTQKNRLNETVLLSTQNMFKLMD